MTDARDSAVVGPEVPEPGQATNVVTDRYECIHCNAVVEVTDFDHRTRCEYEAPTIRCQCKNVPMRRVQKEQ